MGEKKDSFRFTVQFNAGDPNHQQVAAILNEQGRRKAQFLVNAVTHYMNCPETPEAAAAPRIDRQTVEQLVREIVQYAPGTRTRSGRGYARLRSGYYGL